MNRKVVDVNSSSSSKTPLDGSAALFSDEELTALALAADPNVALDDNAVAWSGIGTGPPGLLPNWYMPVPSYQLRGRLSRAVVITLIAGFLVIDAFGLCITSGFLSLA
jgi:hypothetical protein